MVRVPVQLMAAARRSGQEPGKSDPIDALAVAHAALREPVGFQNSAIGPGLRFYVARSYSLMRPPRMGRRWMRFRDRFATG